MANGEQKAWNIMNLIMTGMGAVIIIVLTLGITLIIRDRDSVITLIKDGDAMINGHLAEMRQQNKDTNILFIELVKEFSEFKTQVAIIKNNQDARLEREKNESQRKARIIE